MIQRHHGALGAAIVLVLVVGAAWVIFSPHKTATPSETATTTPTPIASTTAGIYTNGEYGFSFQYPAGVTLEDPFKMYYHLPSYWRANATPDATGTPIVAVVGYRTDSDHAYPRYFDAEIRIGASSDPVELKNCLVAGKDTGEKELPDAMFGSTTFKAFAFQSAAMMQYLKGVSYRVIHEGKCFAIEQLQTGSSYRDDPPGPDTIPDSTLQTHYDELAGILTTFSFARP